MSYPKRAAIELLKLALIVFATGFPASSNALDIVGAASCGDWVKDRADKGRNKVAGESWLVGYLSGIAIDSNKNFLKDKDVNLFYLWMDDYCKNSPLSNTAVGGRRLSMELIKKMPYWLK